MTDRNKFYTVPKAAEKFGVNRRTMHRWVTSGKIKTIVTPGGHYRILSSEIDALLEQNGFSKNSATIEKTILVVDDDEAVRKSLKQRLAREKFTVETAEDGFKAGLKARDIKPGLIILDLMMEGIDGFEVCRTIKANNSLNSTKILIMTGYDTPENRDKAMQDGADAFLSKGDDFKTILRTVYELLAE